MISNSKMFNNKINAPMFIYSILYNKSSPKQISGRESSHPQKLINNIPIDEEIPTKSIINLLNIKEIESTSSCQGTSLKLPTFLILRPINQSLNYIKQLITNLNNQKNIKSGYGMGNGGKYRIGITTSLFYSPENKSEFINWWNKLPSKIQNSLPKN